MRVARALDEFEELVANVNVAERVERTSHVQGIVRLKITDAVEQLADKHDLEPDDIFGEASALAISELEHGAAASDDHKISPWLDNGRFVGHELTFYKFGMIGGAA
jgi:hypothetical protein